MDSLELNSGTIYVHGANVNILNPLKDRAECFAD